MSPPDGATAYGAGALRRAVERIQSAGGSSRNVTLYSQSRGLFELAAGGEIDPEQAWEQLSQAGRAAGLDGAEIRSTLRSARREGAKRPRKSTRAGRADMATLPPIPAAPPIYPPHSAVKALWNATQSVLADERAFTYLQSRGIDPERVSRGGLCRYLPKDASLPDELATELRATLPKTKRGGARKPAPLHGFQLLFPMFDNLGSARSLVLRWMADGGPPLEEDQPKVVALRGQRVGLVLANRAAQALMRRDPERKTLWTDQPLEVVIVEGETDFLCAACEPTDAVRAVFGVMAGSWTDAHVHAIPKRAAVIIATDHDEQGDKYADKISGTFERGRSKRWTPSQGKDVCDAGGLAGGTLT